MVIQEYIRVGSWAPVCRGASLRIWHGEMGSGSCSVGPVVTTGTLARSSIKLRFKGDGSRGGVGHDGLRRGRDRRWKSWSVDGAPVGAPGFRADRGVGTGLGRRRGDEPFGRCGPPAGRLGDGGEAGQASPGARSAARRWAGRGPGRRRKPLLHRRRGGGRERRTITARRGAAG